MNPFKKPFEGIRFKRTIWEDHYPESPKTFIISFLVIILLFISKIFINKEIKLLNRIIETRSLHRS